MTLTHDPQNRGTKRPRALGVLTLTSLFGLLTLSACQTEPTTGQDFISDDPSNGYGDDFGETGQGSTGDPAGEGGDDGEDNGDGDVDISEADIIQREGDTLYALSQFSGLTVVDISNPDDLESLGTWETDAQPFEMYVEAGQAFVMFNDYGFWDYDEGLDEWAYNSSSRLVALDASNPADIQVRGEFMLPGSIQDSRRVGDVLYLVTMEDGWCWSCDDEQKTVVTSIDISDQAHPQLVDQLEFVAENDNWDWQRSVASTTDRMYVAARTWDWQGMGSVIDVIDISAHDGSLVPGAQVSVAGSIDSRWQMDEYEGVLRVISQFDWNDDPLIETFTIESSQSIVPLGQGGINIPMPESLRSVRYDGDRAYAITAEQTDPLFTIDLSDPANPTQRGELEIPGWVFHMEPRGDRVLALGFDPAHPDGSINVSLFDVSVFDTPTLRRRVHFGGDWGEVAEDQNRIHKAFTILDDEQLVLVPFQGWSYDEGNYECYGDYHSGVQLIDWMDDDLTLRGVAPARGRARRAFTHRDRLLTLSDTELASFDFSDRDNPAARDDLSVAVHVDNLIHSGDVWVRMARNWYTSEQVIEIVDAADPGSPEPIGTIDIGGEDSCSYAWIEQLFAIGDHVFVVRNVDSWGENYDYRTVVEVLSIDISDPSNPMIDDTYELDGERSWGYGQLGSVVTDSNWIAQHGQHLALLTYDAQSQAQQVQVLDLSDPANIALAATLARPAGQSQGQLSVLSDTITSWHTEPVENQPGKVRFFFDRLDLSGEPSWRTPINVPGVIVAYDDESGDAFTVDFKLDERQTKADDCYQDPKFWQFDYQMGEFGTCTTIEQLIRQIEIEDGQASLVRSYDVEGQLGLEQLRATDSRIFAKVGHDWWDYVEGDDGNYGETSKLVVLDIDADTPAVHEVDGEEFGGWWNMTAVDGARTVINGGYGQLILVDSTDADALDVQQSSLPGWGGCYRPVIDGDTIYCPMGPYGLETVDW